MGRLALLLFCILPLSAWAEKIQLPGLFNAKSLSLTPISTGNTANLNFKIKFSDGQKLNKTAKSSIGVYEKSGDVWLRTNHIDLNSVFSLGSELQVNKKLYLQTVEGPIAIGSSIYHCANDGGFCVIDHYQGLVKRSKNMSSKAVTISLSASRPTF